MMKRIFLLILLLAVGQIAARAQTPSPTPPKVDDDDVVVINTSLIQVDAVVVDKKGRQVTDLKAADFDIFENGVKQEITNFSYVVVTPNAPAAENNSKTNPVDKSAPPVPTKLKPEQVRRTIALVVDDLGLSFESTARVRDALRKFVDEQMQPNDLAAIIRTGGGIGALQQFTSDKRLLHAAIDRVLWNPRGRGGIGAFAPIGESISDSGEEETTEDEEETALSKPNSDAAIEQFRRDIFTVGTLGAMNFIVNGMSELPGRKAVILLSDGFALVTQDGEGKMDSDGQILDTLRRLTETANRAAIVINTIDARGLVYTGLTAQDSVGSFSPEQVTQKTQERGAELSNTQDGLFYLAEETGGRAFVNNNDIKGSVEKVLEDQKGYYLIGYQPDEAVFDATKRKFNRLTVKIKNPDYKIRYRSGFFGIIDAEVSRPAKPNAQEQINKALNSPFGATEINLRLNTLFGDDAKNGSFIRSLLHVNARDLKFTDEPEGKRKAVFDVVAFTFGDNGVAVDSVSKTYTLSLKTDSDAYRRIMDKGFVYFINVPVKKAGAYQLRVALRDVQGEKIGSANQFIEVPNLKKNRLTLSSLVLQNMTFAKYEKSANAPAVNTAAEFDPQTDTALRRFRRGTVLQYGLAIYNAKTDAAKRPQVTVKMRLFRDGKLIFEGKPNPVDLSGSTDLQRLGFTGAFSLVSKMELGDYVLQIIATDALAKEKRRTTTQWVEFEVIN